MSQSLAWVFSDYEPVIVGRASDGQDPAQLQTSSLAKCLPQSGRSPTGTQGRVLTVSGELRSRSHKWDSARTLPPYIAIVRSEGTPMQRLKLRALHDRDLKE